MAREVAGKGVRTPVFATLIRSRPTPASSVPASCGGGLRILIALATAACGGDTKKDVSRGTGKTADAMSGPIGAPSVPTSRLDFASCLAEDVADDAARAQRCPSFALLSLDYMSSQCTAHGGTRLPGRAAARFPSQSGHLVRQLVVLDAIAHPAHVVPPL